MTPSDEAIFRTKSDFRLPAFSCAQLAALHQALPALGIEPAQIVEAASYSLAMVVRYALGLSAEGGQVGAIVSDCLAGAVALATIRHLANSGAVAQIILLGDERTFKSPARKQLEISAKMQTATCGWRNEAANRPRLGSLLESCHNIICGFSDPLNPDAPSADSTLIEMLNEASTPLHCIECPYGIDPDDGRPSPQALFCSSTLSLGAPLKGLYNGSEYAGRHYLCDISITPAMYESCGVNLAGLFAEQPVLQIYPLKPEE